MNEENTTTEAPAVIDAELPEFLGCREAAAMLRVSLRTLHRFRIGGGGPAYFSFGGRIAYTRADLAAWAAACRDRTIASAGIP